MGWNEFGYFELGNVLGAGNGLELNAGGFGFRLLEKRLVKLAKWKRLLRKGGPLDRGTGATTFDMSIGWLARWFTVREPSKFWADCAQAGEARNIPSIAPAIHVPARMARLLAKKSIAYPISMEGGER